MRRASIVLPEPGGPIIITLCPPAAAISNARLTCICPFTSAKSSAYSLCCASASIVGSMGFISNCPLSSAATCCNEPTGITSIPSTTAASTAFSSGTYIRRNPRSRASAVMGNTPFTPRTSPLSESSPTNATSSSDSGITCCIAAKIATAIGKSNPEPSLRRSAGARLTTHLRWVIRKPEFS